MYHKTYKANLVTYNIGQKLSNLIKLSETIPETDPLAICVQDMFTSTKTLDTIITLFPGYNSHTSGLEHTRLLTLIRRDETNTIEVKVFEKELVSVQIFHIQQLELHTEYLANIYIRPRANYSNVAEALEWIEANTGNLSRLTLMGDTNATAPIWGDELLQRQIKSTMTEYDKLKNERGKLIGRWIERRNLICLNEDKQEPTYRGYNFATSSIDIVLVGQKSMRKWKHIDTIMQPGEGHAIIIIRAARTALPQTSSVKTWSHIDLTKITNEHINTIKVTLAGLIEGWEKLNNEHMTRRMNLITENLCNQILSIQSDITTIKFNHRSTNNRKLIKASELTKHRTQSIVEKLKKLERDEVRARTLRKRHKIKRKKQRLHNKVINKILRTQVRDLRGSDVWECAKYAKRSTIEVSTTELNLSSKEDIEALAKQKFPSNKRNLMGIIQEPETNDQIRISFDETLRAINKLKKKKYNTPDGIRMATFYLIVSQVPNIMHVIARMSFLTGNIPRRAEFTQGIIIPKKAKGQFRIVHISNPIAAFLEMIALARLDFRLEERNLINPDQYGFTALRSRHDLATRILERAYKNKEWGKPTCVVSMDIEAAFDKVDQMLLIRKLGRELGDKSLTKWIGSFLNSRKISIKYQNLKSQYRTVYKGVPQGSALGPILWNYMIHNIEQLISQNTTTSIRKGTTLLKYADDVYLMTTGDDLQALQNEVTAFVSAIKTLGLNVRPEKCSYIIIFPKDSLLDFHQKQQEILINNVKINKTDTINILGIKINNTARIDRQNTELHQKLSTIAKLINKLKRCRIVKSNKSWRILTDGLILSQTTNNYWPIMLRSTQDREWIMKATLKVLKTGFEWPENTPNKIIKLIFDLREPYTLVQKLAAKRLALETGNAYKYLMKATCKLDEPVTRRYGDPSKILRFKEYNPSEIEDRPTIPIWYILEGSRYSALTRIHNGSIDPHLLHSAWYNPCVYTNTLITLNKAANDPHYRNIRLFINKQCSIFQALRNFDNHDQRVIQLRESIYNAKWEIISIDGHPHKALKTLVKLHIKSMNIRVHAGDLLHNLEEWIRTNLENVSKQSNAQRTKATAEKTPQTLDYLVRLLAKKEYNCKSKLERGGNLSAVAKMIEPNVSKWLRLNPSCLNANDMIILGGLVKDPTSNKITKDTAINWCGHCGQTVEPPKLALKHRIDECSKFSYKRKRQLVKEIKQIAGIAIPRGQTNQQK